MHAKFSNNLSFEFDTFGTFELMRLRAFIFVKEGEVAAAPGKEEKGAGPMLGGAKRRGGGEPTLSRLHGREKGTRTD